MIINFKKKKTGWLSVNIFKPFVKGLIPNSRQNVFLKYNEYQSNIKKNQNDEAIIPKNGNNSKGRIHAGENEKSNPQDF